MNRSLIILLVGMLCICGVLVRANNRLPSRGTPSGVTMTDAAVAAQKQVVLDSIAKNDTAAAEAACRPLLSQSTPQALHDLVDEADTLNEVPQVRQVFQDMIAARPNDPDVIWLKTGLAIANVHLGDDKAVDATVQDIIAKNGSDDRAVEALGQIAWAYRKLQQYGNALSLNQYTMDNWPGKDRVAYAQQGIVLCQVGLGNVAAADKALDVLMEKFGTNADASKLVLWCGFGYEDAGEKAGAYRAYGLVVQNYPDTGEAVVAQARRAVASVEAEDVSRMAQDIPILLNQFAVTQNKGESVRYLENGLYWKHVGCLNRPFRQDILTLIDGYLKTVANYMLTTWPDSDWASWARRDLTLVAMYASEDPNAQAAIDRFVADNANRPETAEALISLADQCLAQKKFDQADRTYQYVCDHWPTDKQAVFASAGQAKVRVATGDDAGVETTMRGMMKQYAGRSELGDAVLQVAEAYYEQGLAEESRLLRTQPGYEFQVVRSGWPESVKKYYFKAIERFRDVIQKFPDNAAAAGQAYTFAAVCYDHVGNSRQALEYFSVVPRQYPQYRHADYALLMAARMGSQLRMSGEMTEAEAGPIIREAHEALIKRYPQSKYVKAAQNGTARMDRAGKPTEGGAK